MSKEKAPMTVGKLMHILAKFNKDNYFNIQDRDLNMFDTISINKNIIYTDNYFNN